MFSSSKKKKDETSNLGRKDSYNDVQEFTVPVMGNKRP